MNDFPSFFKVVVFGALIALCVYGLLSVIATVLWWILGP